MNQPKTFFIDELDRAEPILLDKMHDVICGRTKWHHRLAFWFRWTIVKPLQRMIKNV